MSYTWDEDGELSHARGMLNRLARDNANAVTVVKQPYEKALETLQKHVEFLKKRMAEIDAEIKKDEKFISKIEQILTQIQPSSVNSFHIT